MSVVLSGYGVGPGQGKVMTKRVSIWYPPGLFVCWVQRRARDDILEIAHAFSWQSYRSCPRPSPGQRGGEMQISCWAVVEIRLRVGWSVRAHPEVWFCLGAAAAPGRALGRALAPPRIAASPLHSLPPASAVHTPPDVVVSPYPPLGSEPPSPLDIAPLLQPSALHLSPPSTVLRLQHVALPLAQQCNALPSELDASRHPQPEFLDPAQSAVVPDDGVLSPDPGSVDRQCRWLVQA